MNRELVHGYHVALYKLLSVRERWTQATNARDWKGRPTKPQSENAVCFCLAGGCFRVAGDDANLLVPALKAAIKKRVSPERRCNYIKGFNDTHPWEEVLEVVKEAMEATELPEDES
jgi:hypothetical protein